MENNYLDISWWGHENDFDMQCSATSICPKSNKKPHQHLETMIPYYKSAGSTPLRNHAHKRVDNSLWILI